MAVHCVIDCDNFEVLYLGADEAVAQGMAVAGTHWTTDRCIDEAVVAAVREVVLAGMRQKVEQGRAASRSAAISRP
jgi:hypothetical protein